MSNPLFIGAEAGIASFQNELGNAYIVGNGVPKDYAEAVKWFRQAADQGDADGQCNLATMYNQGLGVKKDYVEAVKWFMESAKQGHPVAQFHLGIIYQNGEGVRQDYVEACKWFSRAAAGSTSRDKDIIEMCFKSLDRLTPYMTHAQVTEARKRASEGYYDITNDLIRVRKLLDSP